MIAAGLTLLVPLALMLGVFIGILGAVWLKREDMRVSQRGVDDARHLLQLAGLWPVTPELRASLEARATDGPRPSDLVGSASLPSVPTHAERR
jgi:hypothetical protein